MDDGEVDEEAEEAAAALADAVAAHTRPKLERRAPSLRRLSTERRPSMESISELSAKLLLDMLDDEEAAEATETKLTDAVAPNTDKKSESGRRKLPKPSSRRRSSTNGRRPSMESVSELSATLLLDMLDDDEAAEATATSFADAVATDKRAASGRRTLPKPSSRRRRLSSGRRLSMESDGGLSELSGTEIVSLRDDHEDQSPAALLRMLNDDDEAAEMDAFAADKRPSLPTDVIFLCQEVSEAGKN